MLVSLVIASSRFQYLKFSICLFRIGVIFFIVMNQIFGNLSAIDLFIRQKHIFM